MSESPVTPNMARSEGLAALRAGNPAVAINTLSPYAVKNPGDSEVLAALGVAYQQKGLPHEALARFDRAVAASPLDANYHYLRAVVLHTMGRFDEASSGYQQALRLNPTHAKAREALVGVAPPPITAIDSSAVSAVNPPAHFGSSNHSSAAPTGAGPVQPRSQAGPTSTSATPIGDANAGRTMPSPSYSLPAGKLPESAADAPLPRSGARISYLIVAQVGQESMTLKSNDAKLIAGFLVGSIAFLIGLLIMLAPVRDVIKGMHVDPFGIMGICLIVVALIGYNALNRCGETYYIDGRTKMVHRIGLFGLQKRTWPARAFDYVGFWVAPGNNETCGINLYGPTGKHVVSFGGTRTSDPESAQLVYTAIHWARLLGIPAALDGRSSQAIPRLAEALKYLQ